MRILIFLSILYLRAQSVFEPITNCASVTTNPVTGFTFNQNDLLGTWFEVGREANIAEDPLFEVGECTQMTVSLNPDGTLKIKAKHILRPSQWVQKPWFDADCDANGVCLATYAEMGNFVQGTVRVIFVDANVLVMYACLNYIDVGVV